MIGLGSDKNDQRRKQASANIVMLTLPALRCPWRGGGGVVQASQSSDCTTSDRRPGKVISVFNYFDDGAFDCDS